MENIEKMVHNAKRHADADYNDSDLAKYRKLIEDSKKPFFYPRCDLRYMRLFVVLNLLQLKVVSCVVGPPKGHAIQRELGFRDHLQGKIDNMSIGIGSGKDPYMQQ